MTRSGLVFEAAVALFLATFASGLAEAQQRPTGQPRTPAQQQAIRQGVLTGKEAAAKNNHEAATIYNNLSNAANVADKGLRRAASQATKPWDGGTGVLGGLAYDAGKGAGNYIVNHPVPPPQLPPPPGPKPGYTYTAPNLPKVPQISGTPTYPGPSLGPRR